MKRTSLLLAALCLITSSVFAARESGGRMAPAAIEIEFWSPGNGIDSTLKRKVTTLIESEDKAGKLIAHTVRPWGREGEITICVEHRSYEDFLTFRNKVQALAARGQNKTNINYKASCE